MAINPADAAAAYKATATNAVKGLTGDDTASEPSSQFLDMVKGAINNTIDANHAAENISQEAVKGRAELTDVVTAVANAETQLQTVVTVRDRIISAYQEIMRMPI